MTASSPFQNRIQGKIDRNLIISSMPFARLTHFRAVTAPGAGGVLEITEIIEQRTQSARLIINAPSNLPESGVYLSWLTGKTKSRTRRERNDA
jgi:hypothetical protein